MSSQTKRNKIRNEVIRNKVEVANIEFKMREMELRWFDHVKKRDLDLVGRCARIIKNDSLKTKEELGEVIRQGLEDIQLTKDIILDRKVWNLGL